MTTNPEAGMRLAPCPFCGNDVATQAFWYGCERGEANNPRGFHVFCLECSETDALDGPRRDTLEEAITAWNTRAAAPVAPCWNGGGNETEWRCGIPILVNPDGPEAASRIAQLEAKLATAVGALERAASRMAGMASAYQTYGKRHSSQGKAETDAMFGTRSVDFQRYAHEVRQALASIQERT